MRQPNLRQRFHPVIRLSAGGARPEACRYREWRPLIILPQKRTVRYPPSRTLIVRFRKHRCGPTPDYPGGVSYLKIGMGGDQKVLLHRPSRQPKFSAHQYELSWSKRSGSSVRFLSRPRISSPHGDPVKVACWCPGRNSLSSMTLFRARRDQQSDPKDASEAKTAPAEVEAWLMARRAAPSRRAPDVTKHKSLPVKGHWDMPEFGVSSGKRNT